jgi:hypothetical protein
MTRLTCSTESGLSIPMSSFSILSRDVLDQMFTVSRSVALPVAMFVDKTDAAMIDAAIDAGVSAYIVDGLRKPILDTTISRFNAFAKLKQELETAKVQLDDRKAIDRANALIMRAKSIPEDQAYALLRQVAMNENNKIAEVARSVITAAELLQGGKRGRRPAAFLLELSNAAKTPTGAGGLTRRSLRSSTAAWSGFPSGRLDARFHILRAR